MSQYPYYGPAGQPYYTHWPSAPAHHQTPPNEGFPNSSTAYPQYSYMPVIIPMPVQVATTPAPVVQSPHTPEAGITYVTNHIYKGESESSPFATFTTSEEYDWEPSTASTATKLSGKAFIVNTMDNNLLRRPVGFNKLFKREFWVIRAWHNGELIPGKYSVTMKSAKITYGGKEIPVENFEVLTAKPSSLIWLPAANNNVPPRAIPGGRTDCGETLFIGRVKASNVFIPGKVHLSLNACYVGYCGTETPYKNYDVLCLPW